MRKIVSTLTAAACVAAVCIPAQAGEVFAGAGTTGVELGFAAKLGPSTGIHLGGEFLDYKRNWENDGTTYDAKFKFSTLGVYGNYFLTERFRLTAGLSMGNRKVTGTGVSSGGTVTVNGVVYPVAPGDSLTMEAKFPSASPYLGVGFGHADNGPGVGFYFDAGALFGRPKVTLTPRGALAANVQQSDLDAEQQKIERRLRVYPVIKVGLTIGF